MDIKKQLKKSFLFSFTIVAILVISIISSSYALLMNVSNDINAEVVSVGDLQMTYTGGSNIDHPIINPMSEREAVTDPNNAYTFTIQNLGTEPYIYKIYLKNNSDFASSPILNNSYVRLDFNSTGTRTLSDLNNGQIFDGYLEAGQARLYTLKLWTDSNIPKSELEKQIHLKIVVEGEATTASEIE